MAKKAKKSTSTVGFAGPGAHSVQTDKKTGNTAITSIKNAAPGGLASSLGIDKNPANPATPPINKDTPLDQVPLTPGDIASIGQVNATYNAAQSQGHQDLYNAAMAYGDQGLVNQYGKMAGIGDAGLTVNPNAALPTIARQTDEAKTSTGKQLNQNNTFFSGIHLDALRKINDESSRRITQALLDFKEKERAYLDALASSEAIHTTDINKIKGSRLDQIIASMLK